MIAANCGMPVGGEDGVVAEDAAEVVLVGKDLVLQRQEDAGGIDEVDERQAVLHGDALGTEHLLDGHREERAGLHGGVVGDDHHPPAGDRADAGDDAGGGAPPHSRVHVPRGPQAELEERRVGSSLAMRSRGEAALLVLAFDRLRAAAGAEDGLLRGGGRRW